MKNNIQKQQKEFIKLLPQLEPVEVIAVARILNVEVTKDKNAETLIVEILNAFTKADKTRRDELLIVLRAAVSKESENEK